MFCQSFIVSFSGSQLWKRKPRPRAVRAMSICASRRPGLSRPRCAAPAKPRRPHADGAVSRHRLLPCARTPRGWRGRSNASRAGSRTCPALRQGAPATCRTAMGGRPSGVVGVTPAAPAMPITLQAPPGAGSHRMPPGTRRISPGTPWNSAPPSWCSGVTRIEHIAGFQGVIVCPARCSGEPAG